MWCQYRVGMFRCVGVGVGTYVYTYCTYMRICACLCTCAHVGLIAIDADCARYSNLLSV